MKTCMMELLALQNLKMCNFISFQEITKMQSWLTECLTYKDTIYFILLLGICVKVVIVKKRSCLKIMLENFLESD